MLTRIRDRIHALLAVLPHPWRWLAVAVLGTLVVVVGVVLLPLPGPGTLIILLGVAILSVEFEWARELAAKGEQGVERIVRSVKARLLRRKPQPDADAVGS